MKNFKILILLSSMFIVTGCGSTSKSSNSSVDSSESSLLNSSLDSQNNNSTESLEESKTSSKVEYATWPSATIETLCLRLGGKCTETIPSYDYALEIELDFEEMANNGYFGIYCYVESNESESIYMNKLKENKWETSETKIEGFYEAYSPEHKIWLNFAYDSSYKDLEIYVSEAPITSWPEELINENLQYLSKDTKTTIPSFEASLYVVNYYASYSMLAINGYDVNSNILTTYKNKITTLGWEVSNGSADDEYEALSPAKDISITFYYDDSRNEFNIDVQKKAEIASNWPASGIAGLVASLGLTGEVMEYNGDYSGVEINNEYFPPCVYVYVENGKQSTSANAYNQMLLDNGYVVAGKMYGEDIYNLPGNTLAYHATFLAGNCFTIELFDVATLSN